MHASPPAPAPLVDGADRDALVAALRLLDDATHPSAPPLQRLQALAGAASAYRALQAWTQAEACLLQALRWSACVGADASVSLVCELAEVLVSQADVLEEDDAPAARRIREQARDHALQAAELARRCADAHWEVHVLLRVSEALDRCGDHDDAIALQCRALNLLVRDELPALTGELPNSTQRLM